MRVGRGAARGGDFGLQAVKMGVEGAGGGVVGARGQRLGQQEAASGVAPVGVCHAYIRVFGVVIMKAPGVSFTPMFACGVPPACLWPRA